MLLLCSKQRRKIENPGSLDVERSVVVKKLMENQNISNNMYMC